MEIKVDLQVTSALDMILKKYPEYNQEVFDLIFYYKQRLKRMELFYKELDKELLEVENSSCKKGCFYCCYEPVYASYSEIEYIASKINFEDLDIDLLKRQEKYTSDNWLDQKHDQRKCVFLKDNKCSIYKFRPASCRNHISVDDPEKCNLSNSTKHKRNKVTINFNMKANAMISALWTNENIFFGTLSSNILRFMRRKNESESGKDKK